MKTTLKIGLVFIVSILIVFIIYIAIDRNNGPEIVRNEEVPDISDKAQNIEKRNIEYKDITSLSINYVNDLEKGLNSDIYTKISAIKKDLIDNGAAKALMSGSGGAVFGVYENDKEIEESINKLRKKYRFVYKFENI